MIISQERFKCSVQVHLLGHQMLSSLLINYIFIFIYIYMYLICISIFVKLFPLDCHKFLVYKVNRYVSGIIVNLMLYLMRFLRIHNPRNFVLSLARVLLSTFSLISYIELRTGSIYK